VEVEYQILEPIFGMRFVEHERRLSYAESVEERYLITEKQHEGSTSWVPTPSY
jgi:hypothetical protein